MVALLRQAGFTANFVLGTIQLTPAQAANWLNVNNSNANTVNDLLAHGGIPVTVTSNPDGSLASVQLSHMWVQVTLGGINYVFDPSFKTYSYISGVPLAQTMGFDQTYFTDLAEQGTTVTPDFVQNVNAGNIRGQLVSMAGRLISYIRTNRPGARLADIIGGKTIKQIPAQVRQTTLPYEAPGDTPTIFTGDIPSNYKNTLEVKFTDSHQNVEFDQTFIGDQI